MDYWSDPVFVTVFGTVLLVRFVLPFTILRLPLPGILACLVVDAIDQTVFQWFGYDPPFYQSYDKAMDVFYLGIAWIATMRNWTSRAAFDVSRFLFFYRQAGVVAFELTQVRALLLVFPNTFEYFFIAVEAIRTRWRDVARSRRFWLVTAALIWIFVKLPQEYWIHIAQLDVTDTIRDVPWFGPAIVIGVLSLLGTCWFVVRPRLAPAERPFSLVAPALPTQLDTEAKRAAWVVRHRRVWSAASLEKAALVGLLLVIFATILDVDVDPLRLVAWVGIFVLLNAATGLRRARAGRITESLPWSFAGRFAGNLALLVTIDTLLYRAMPIGAGLFFTLLFCVLVTTYDRYRPVYELRLAALEDA